MGNSPPKTFKHLSSVLRGGYAPTFRWSGCFSVYRFATPIIIMSGRARDDNSERRQKAAKDAAVEADSDCKFMSPREQDGRRLTMVCECKMGSRFIFCAFGISVR